MTVLERIKETARQKKNISLTVLEQELGYSNGSLAKAKDIPSSRIAEIANFLDVSMEFLMTGIEKSLDEKYGDEMTHLYALIRNDVKLATALHKYFSLSEEKKEYVVGLINIL